jgi:hypothetical protein
MHARAHASAPRACATEQNTGISRNKVFTHIHTDTHTRGRTRHAHTNKTTHTITHIKHIDSQMITHSTTRASTHIHILHKKRTHPLSRMHTTPPRQRKVTHTRNCTCASLAAGHMKPAHKCTQKNACTHKRHARTHTHTKTHSHIHPHTHNTPPPHTHTHKHTRTDTKSHKHTHTNTHRNTHTHTCTQTHTTRTQRPATPPTWNISINASTSSSCSVL